ncbi:UDP-N-acetylmuramyl pentapeptide synthase [Gaiella occulta]|uniref:UDP-N-acetylmuramyl pentapeptide synthase n=1 Tax=Gaiella occulta TaxID=1002870 RepID=A0A7M2YZP7_9ACTN|nr:UDP-N-acetylmuramoyl-tripeptide--D-alanyl-D-alanine ligase [Gaiella occulta]RDI74993.1 UDP-N-acetylmuramyl pentapeptide synthase [Gaiella occulta]
MIPVAWDEVAALELGALEGGGTITGITADSRLAGPGDLFVALNSGVAYVGEARARGASTLVPDDQHAALAALASLVRGKSPARIVAVVGSTGKTSTKDILGALCAAVTPTVWADASQNNEIGLPLTVCRLEVETRVLVTEMGMRGLGQVGDLCAIARPHVAVVTSIGPEHLELVGSIENVARANAEAIAALPPGGVAVVPADAPQLEPFLGRTDIEIRRFDRSAANLDGGAWRFALPGRDLVLELPFRSRHMAENALAALTAYDALGLPLGRAQEGASRIVLSRWRGEETSLPGGGMVVNDAYNANPTSMHAALVDLAERAGGRRRVAILGEMAELGDDADRYHREIGALVARIGIHVLVAVGENARGYLQPGVDEMHWIPNVEAFDTVVGVLRPGDAVLVKGSRAVGLEGIPARIEKLGRTWFAS